MQLENTTNESNKIAGKLNSGEPLKSVIPMLGKLQFCQPHAQGFYENTYINIGSKNEDSSMVIPEPFDSMISSNIQSNYLYNNPRYNLSINTKNTIKQYSEFISTLQGIKGTYMAGLTFFSNVYTGFTGEQLKTFNQKMLETMKSVYVYNPDYDSLPVNIGEVYIQNNKPMFTSNIISDNAKLDADLNDYIYIGPIKFSKYLTELQKHSNINIEKIKQLQLKADLTYCGGINPYLITPLTYNTEVPDNLHSELEFNAKDQLVIKHSDGSNSFLTGSPNKKLLYGYDSTYNKLIQLDVSNYKINESGSLELIYDKITKNETQIVSLKLTSDILKKLISDTGYEFNYEFIGKDGKTTSITVPIKINCEEGKNTIVFVPEDDHEVINSDYSDQFGLSLYIVHKDGYSNSQSFTLQNGSVVSDNFTYNISTSYNLSLIKKSAQCLKNVSTTDVVQNYTLKKIQDFKESTLLLLLNDYSEYSQEDLINNNRSNFIQSMYYGDESSILKENNSVKITYNTSSNTSDNVWLYKITLDTINIQITRATLLSQIDDTIVNCDVTKDYFKISKPESNTNFYQYDIVQKYLQASIRGSSITLNDLIYEPNQEDHRLFIKGNNCKSTNSWIRYRDKDQPSNDGELNQLQFYIGPCFTINNL